MDPREQRDHQIAPETHPNVLVVDWEARAAEIEGELSASDGRIHLSTQRAKDFYTNLILQGLGRPTYLAGF